MPTHYTETNYYSPTKPLQRKWLPLVTQVALAIAVLVLAGLVTLWWLETAPINYPVNAAFTVAPGQGVRSIASELKAAGLIRSEYLFYYRLRQDFDPTRILAGTYNLAEPLTTSGVASLLTSGQIAIDLTRLTLVEGERALLMAERAAAILPEFHEAEYLEKALPLEGRLFPDTYLVPPDYTASDLLALQLQTFSDRTAPLSEKMAAHTLSLDDIIILASILEREANSETSMKMVSGILQNRLRINMALQADATMEYILDKPLSALTPSDLRDTDSPYNTYLYSGLPPTPIGNPGLVAIRAVLEPTPSDFLFYITGQDGNFYYANDFDTHRMNIARHLR